MTLAVGATLGRYEIVDRLGQGGMAAANPTGSRARTTETNHEAATARCSVDRASRIPASVHAGRSMGPRS